MITDCVVGDADSVERFVPNLAIDFLSAFHGGAEPLAGLVYFFPGHGGGLFHDGLGVLGERAHVIADRLLFFVHKFSFVNCY